MRALLLLTVSTLLVACASSSEDERDEETAFVDFIEINELESVDVIRTMDQLSSILLNDEYVIVSSGRKDFLVEYYTRCIEEFDGRPKPDIRRNARAIYAKADTYRGCRIKAIYALEAGHVDELRQLGRSVGSR